MALLAGYAFRALTAADRSAVDLVCSQSFPDGDYILRVFDDWVADRQAHFYGAFARDGTLLGIGRLRPIDGGVTCWCEGYRVAPASRRSGVGLALLSYAIDWVRAHDARRLRAAVHSENEASMRLFAAAGFRVAARFDRWQASPSPGGRLPRPLPIAELDLALAFIRRSAPYVASHGTYAVGWTIHDLDADRLAMHLERQEVLLAGDSIGALGIVKDFTTEGDGRPSIAFLCGAPIAVTRLLRGIRTLARLRGLNEFHSTVPTGSNLDGMLAQTGFTQRSGTMCLQQFDLT